MCGSCRSKLGIKRASPHPSSPAYLNFLTINIRINPPHLTPSSSTSSRPHISRHRRPLLHVHTSHHIVVRIFTSTSSRPHLHVHISHHLVCILTSALLTTSSPFPHVSVFHIIVNLIDHICPPLRKDAFIHPCRGVRRPLFSIRCFGHLEPQRQSNRMGPSPLVSRIEKQH